jgi:hypothetical protein
MVNAGVGFQRSHFVTEQDGTKLEGIRERGRNTTVKLFDVVDMAWTAPFPATYIYEYYLKKLVVKCSACKWTTGARVASGIAAHLKQLRERHEGHVGAESSILPSELGGVRVTCSGCTASFQDTIGFKRHMIQFNPEILEQHIDAVPQVINRFVLEPPAVSNETGYVTPEPVNVQVARSQRPAGTRRRRGRRGRGSR